MTAASGRGWPARPWPAPRLTPWPGETGPRIRVLTGRNAALPAIPRHSRPPGRERREDPQPLTAAIDGLIDDQGWAQAAATGVGVRPVGADRRAGPGRAHQPETLTDGELTVTADSTAWATQLRLLAAQLVRRLNAELGDGSVHRVKVRGPASGAAPAGRMAGPRQSRAPGHLRVAAARLRLSRFAQVK